MNYWILIIIIMSQAFRRNTTMKVLRLGNLRFILCPIPDHEHFFPKLSLLKELLRMRYYYYCVPSSFEPDLSFRDIDEIPLEIGLFKDLLT